MSQINLKDKIVLFDFDGTIVATEVLAQEIVGNYLLQKKIPNQAEFSLMIIGRTWKAATEVMYERATALGFSIDEPSVLLEKMMELYRDRVKKGVELIPGVREKLAEIKAKCKFMGIVTGSERAEVQAILEFHGIQSFFDRIWAYGDYLRSKPEPDPFLQAMEDLRCKPEEVFVFEDSKAGMESAHRAGVPWIQIAYEAHAWEADPRSVHVVRDWHALKILP